MKKLLYLCIFFMCLIILHSSCGRSLQKADYESWLNSKKERPRINISGDWNSPVWGEVKLKQNGNKLSGTIGGYELEGVVSGKKVYGTIGSSGYIYWTFELAATSKNSLEGNYAEGLINAKGAYKYKMMFTGGVVQGFTGGGKSFTTSSEGASDLDEQMNILAAQIIDSMTRKKESKIAVIDFTDIDGVPRRFGKLIAEDLIVRLHNTGRFRVVERSQLKKVLKEMNLSSSALFDSKTSTKIGKFLGVDAIITGTMVDLGSYIKVNARLISVKTATIMAVATAKIEKTKAINRLWKRK